MTKILLLNMPFASLNLPSIGLTQIKSVLESTFGDQISVEILYLNHDFAHLMGTSTYQNISNSATHHNAGFGDWLFRQVAFPDLEDNTEEYFGRFYPQRDERTETLKQRALEERGQLEGFIDELITKYRIDEADIVGVTSMFMQNVACLSMARKLKERNPKVITAMGGANCESPMGQEIAKNAGYVDFVFSGPALKSFPAVVQHYLDNELEKAHAVKGVFTKENCRVQTGLGVVGHTTQPGGVGEELDIDAGIILDYGNFLDTFEANFPNREVEPILLFETSRGCWWGERAHCTFCGLNGESMAYRAMSPEKAIQQFEAMFKYADRAPRINCVDNILARNYFTEVFPYINPPANVRMFYEVKADLTEEEMAVLSKAQVKVIQPGIESMATSTLKLMKKGTSVFQNLFFLKNCITYDVLPEWNLLVGFPGEGEDVYKSYVRDLPLLMHLPPPSGVFPVRFDRYSPYFTKSKEYGLDLHPVDYYPLIYPFGSESLSHLAYYFTDHNFSAKYFLTMAKWIGKVRKKFEDWERLWSSQNRGSKPQLYFKQLGERNIVHDSRSGQMVEHYLEDTAVQVLQHMHGKPKRIADFQHLLGHLPGFDAEKTVNFLQERGLVFQEQDRYLSLVIPLVHQPIQQSVPLLHEVGAPAMPGVKSFN
ncbi:MAG: RiPP maturation radical SAM C-methyltransferase [Pyrinomonadaceae bacterium]